MHAVWVPMYLINELFPRENAGIPHLISIDIMLLNPGLSICINHVLIELNNEAFTVIYLVT